MAISKDEKSKMLAEYKQWLSSSQALVVTTYTGMTMKRFDDLRTKLREIGSELHVMKNTLVKVALKESGYEASDALFEGSTAVGLAFEDVPGTAKIILDFGKDLEYFKVKGGYLGHRPVNADQVKAMSEMPPLPVVRAQLMAMLLAPATQLVRVLAEPGRGLAAVIKARVDAATPAE